MTLALTHLSLVPPVPGATDAVASRIENPRQPDLGGRTTSSSQNKQTDGGRDAVTTIDDASNIEKPTGDFARYPAVPLSGPFQMPTFSGDQAGYAGYRTMLRKAASGGANFAGHYAFARIGCGMECTSNYVIDGTTGRVYDFPLGGEDYLELTLFLQPGSNLVKAYWVVPDTDFKKCNNINYVLTKSLFKQLSSADDITCPNDDGSFH